MSLTYNRLTQFKKYFQSSFGILKYILLLGERELNFICTLFDFVTKYYSLVHDTSVTGVGNIC
jgi:hypothetical protein